MELMRSVLEFASTVIGLVVVVIEAKTQQQRLKETRRKRHTKTRRRVQTRRKRKEDC